LKNKHKARIHRRNGLPAGAALPALPSTTILNLGCTPNQTSATRDAERPLENAGYKDKNNTFMETVMHIQYLEIVTTDVETACTPYSKMHGVTFSAPDQKLGGARTARLANGGTLGVRAPMHNAEETVVRPYILVKDIEAIVAEAAGCGAVIAVPPMEIAGHGTSAIVIQDGIESGLWQL
jgi:predicted enzyme related to lactoylglutathione lyase